MPKNKQSISSVLYKNNNKFREKVTDQFLFIVSYEKFETIK